MDLRLIPGALLAVVLLAARGGAQTAGEGSSGCSTCASAPARTATASAGSPMA